MNHHFFYPLLTLDGAKKSKLQEEDAEDDTGENELLKAAAIKKQKDDAFLADLVSNYKKRKLAEQDSNKKCWYWTKCHDHQIVARQQAQDRNAITGQRIGQWPHRLVDQYQARVRCLTQNCVPIVVPVRSILPQFNSFFPAVF